MLRLQDRSLLHPLVVVPVGLQKSRVRLHSLELMKLPSLLCVVVLKERMATKYHLKSLTALDSSQPCDQILRSEDTELLPMNEHEDRELFHQCVVDSELCWNLTSLFCRPCPCEVPCPLKASEVVMQKVTCCRPARQQWEGSHGST